MTTSELFRRDPQKGKKEFSAHKGFTLIEVMIAIGVLAIIMSLALPSYRSIMEKRQVTSSAEQLSAFMSAAQMEAVKRNQPVAIVCSTDAGNCQAIVLEDVDEGDEILRTLEFSNLKADVIEITYNPADGQVAFDPARGMLAQEDISTTPIEIQLNSAMGEYALNITMLPTGRISMCSADRADKTVPGYVVCGEGG